MEQKESPHTQTYNRQNPTAANKVYGFKDVFNHQWRLLWNFVAFGHDCSNVTEGQGRKSAFSTLFELSQRAIQEWQGASKSENHQSKEV